MPVAVSHVGLGNPTCTDSAATALLVSRGSRGIERATSIDMYAADAGRQAVADELMVTELEYRLAQAALDGTPERQRQRRYARALAAHARATAAAELLLLQEACHPVAHCFG